MKIAKAFFRIIIDLKNEYLYETCNADVEINKLINNNKNDHGRTPLFYTSINGHLEVAKFHYKTCNASNEIKSNNERLHN